MGAGKSFSNRFCRQIKYHICLFAFGTFAFLTFPLSADSILNFPRLSGEENRLTGIAVANPGSAEAVAVLTAFGERGQLLSGDGINNPVQIQIPAGRQLARLTSELFGNLDPGTVAWFQLTSETDGLTGFFLFLNVPPTTLFDGADLPESDFDLVFEKVFIGPDFSTELNLINPSSGLAVLTLTIITDEEQVERELTLPAKGVIRLDAEDFFGISDNGSFAVVRVSSNQRVAGFELVRGPNDAMGLNARAVGNQLNTLYFPQLAVLGGFETLVNVTNSSSEPVILTFIAHQADGELFTEEIGDQNPQTRILGPGETLREDVEEMFGFEGVGPLVGWLEVESTSIAVNGALSYELPGTGSFAAIAAVVQGTDRALLSHLATIQDFFTGLAILNAGQLIANVRILAADVDGNLLGTHTTALSAGERLVKLITELIPEAAGQAGGFIWIKSDLPVYVTSLFGTNDTRILANIPPQPIPESFNPDEAIALGMVEAPIAFLPENGSQQFMLEGVVGNPEWRVNGVVGGSAEFGTVTQTGLYQAPAVAPVRLPVSLTATVDNQTAGASVDVLNKEVLFSNLGIIQSVAFLDGLQRLYSAELAAQGNLGFSIRNGEDTTTIFEMTTGVRQSIQVLEGERVSKMIPYAAAGKEFLLMAAQTAGQVLRLDPLTQQLTTIADGLNMPATLVIDPTTGDLLVAEADEISIIPAAQLSQGLTVAAVEGAAEPDPTPKHAIPVTAEGMAVNRCTGDIYLSQPETGSVLRFDRATGETETLADGLTEPGKLLALYRRGVACPDSFTLLIADSGSNQVFIFVAAQDLVVEWTDAPAVAHLAFLAADNGIFSSDGVLLAEHPDLGQIAAVGLRGLYSTDPTNPPSPNQLNATCLGSVVFEDPDLASAVRVQLGLGAGENIICLAATQVEVLGLNLEAIDSLEGLQAFQNLQILEVADNQISDLGPLSELLNLNFLALSGNQITELDALVRNKGLGPGDVIELKDNPLGMDACSDIGTLVGRQAAVRHDLSCPTDANELLVNGGFETGTFEGWTVSDLADGSGSWFITGDTVSPLSGNPTVGTATGSFYAVTDQVGPGTHSLTQTFMVPEETRFLILRFDMFVNDVNMEVINCGVLDHTGDACQFGRVDILAADADPFTTDPGDVVVNLYVGADADLTNPYTAYFFDLLDLGLTPGAIYQLRFAEADNQLFFNMGVDNVSLVAEVPEE